MTENLRQLQLAELEIFKQFDEICKKNSISYYALGGTLLGAVRHQGFIPWDDDMDIGVPRPDYDKLCTILEKELTDPLCFRTYHNDKCYIRYFGHLENMNIQITRHDNLTAELTYAWIDIFPLDSMPNNILLRTLHRYYVLLWRAIYRFSCFDQLVNVNKKNRPWYEKILIFIGQHTPVQKMFDTYWCLSKLEKLLTKVPYEKSNYLVNAMGAYKFKEMFHKEVYGEGAFYPFEDVKIRGPVDYDTVCKQLYGDYMKLPALDDRNHHGLQTIVLLNKKDNEKNG